MTSLGVIIAKDFTLLLRDRTALLFLTLAPIVVMAVAGFSLASLYGADPVGQTAYDLPIVDEDGGELARQIEDRLSGDESVRVRRVASREEAQRLKLAALGRLTANIAHEIRNPLSAISHAAELLDEEQRGSDRSRLTRIIHDNTQRLERLVSDVLQLNRRDRAAADRVALESWLPAFVEDFCANESVPADRIALEIGRPVTMEFDREHLRQVLWNLLRNAADAASVGGRHVRIDAQRSADATTILVSDDGPGIAADKLAHIFDPFFTTKSKGSGLGLAICHAIVAEHRGHIDVTSELGKGTTMEVTIPRKR